MSNKINWKEKATIYAERYGIIDYKVKGARLKYYTFYPRYLEPDVCYRVVVDLKTNKEIERAQLSKCMYKLSTMNRFK